MTDMTMEWTNARDLADQAWDGVTRPAVDIRLPPDDEINKKLFLSGIICVNCFRLGIDPNCNVCMKIQYDYLIAEDGKSYIIRKR